MLVISRKAGESILISDDIKITVISLSGERVTIGIEAPKEIRIIREELLETVLANKEASELCSDYVTAELADLMKRIKK